MANESAAYRNTVVHSSVPREDPRVKAFRDRARLFILPQPEPASMGQRLDMALTARTRRGAVLRQELRYPLMTEEEIQQKFQLLAGLRLESRRVAELEGQLKAIESVRTVVRGPCRREIEFHWSSRGGLVECFQCIVTVRHVD